MVINRSEREARADNSIIVHNKGFGIRPEVCERSLLKDFKQRNEIIIAFREKKLSGDSEENS